MEHVTQRVVEMLADARRSFDLATSALLGGVDPASVSEELWATDARINQAEQELRRELVVHVAVSGADDIGQVLGNILLIKKIERIGDQAKNILDLGLKGVSLAHADDTEQMMQERSEISAMFGEVAVLLAEPDTARLDELVVRSDALLDAVQTRIDDALTSDGAARDVVPRAIYDRFLKRIVANLLGVARTAHDPLPALGPVDDLED